MMNATRQWRIVLPLLLAGIVLRAFIPAGYMPAAPGKGLLFELCHDGMPAAFMSALAGHGHHGHHGDHHDHGSSGDCSMGHILALAFADSPDIPDVSILPATGFHATLVNRLRLASRRFAYAPRGPPLL
jgi:hypothetical protein